MKKTLILSILLMLLAIPYTIEAGSKKSNKKLSTNPSAVKPAGQENELGNKLKQANLEIETVGKEEKKLVAPENIIFDRNSSVIKSSFKSSLDTVVEILKKYPDNDVLVSGYTDDTGNATANERLSKKRASSVASYLISKGIKSSRIKIVGRGSEEPVASNSTESGREQNRRVEIKILGREQ